MDAIDERFAVYTAIIFICSAVGALAGGFAAAATFAVIAVGVELAYWLGRVIEDSGHTGAAS
ncbi:MAG: hypothetical protein L7T24_09435 [Luminiphilus sp.]|nr:hypothetical protein [Luminiphilus sp.]